MRLPGTSLVPHPNRIVRRRCTRACLAATRGAMRVHFQLDPTRKAHSLSGLKSTQAILILRGGGASPHEG